jgi:hypothetical protein
MGNVPQNRRRRRTDRPSPWRHLPTTREPTSAASPKSTPSRVGIGDHDVGRLDISVHQPLGVRVRRISDLPPDVEDTVGDSGSAVASSSVRPATHMA